ncbi:MAG TPA: mechanosensitive ion channel family protein, partial [Polyangiaceae bacterium]|nr:mechanosensitive ion channel family protein [Polyangiaceae bacterium]
TMDTVAAKVTDVGMKVIGAFILYLVVRWLINWVIHLVQRSLERQKVDPTLLRYVGTVIGVLANMALVVAILGYFGVETTTFAALLAGAGIAIGTAWGGLLSNFAAGAFLVILRPYKVGDFVAAGDVTGTVRAIGLFVTTIDTPDNVHTHVGNGKILAGTIQNFSANSFRRVDLTAQLHYSVDVTDAIKRLKEKLAAIPNVVSAPAPDVEILQFTEFGPVLAVRPYTHTDHYWQVYFDANKVIVSVGAEAQYPPVERTIKLKDQAENGVRPSHVGIKHG